MFAIIILSALASFAFGNAAQKKGYDSPRFWVYPLAVGSGIFLVASLLNIVAHAVIKDDGSVFLRTYPYAITALSVLLLLTVIARAWKQIKALPPKR